MIVRRTQMSLDSGGISETYVEMGN